jgi:ABC-type antimicrobial peptide transport system permease subunit
MRQFIQNFRKQKFIGILNIFSLSLGIMVSVIIGLWTIDELSFDSFHKNKDRIYRAIGIYKINKNGVFSPEEWGAFHMPFGQEAKAELPAIEFILLNKDFLLWVGISFVIACPVAYIWLQSWLSNFVVRTPLSIWVFISVGVIAVIITLLTTGYQTWKVATTNPIEVMKNE